ncbi:hypothetical protein SS209_00142 [Salmonella enterica subsp. enterica serovar Senftenberg str. SS209]|nr:hypothetical protein SS209_00142 [Salmonella enterica subsp. enterica serovar Senftenberg str. SS209]
MLPVKLAFSSKVEV